MQVKFLEAREVKDGEGIVIQKFKVGQVVELSNASARHWINRGAAFDVCAAAKEAADMKAEAEIAASVAGAEEAEPEVAAPVEEKAEVVEEKPAVATGSVEPTSHKRGRGRPRSA